MSRTHTEIVDVNHGKGWASFRVEGKGFNNSIDVVSIKYDYHAQNNLGLSIGLTIQKSSDGGLHFDGVTEANFALEPKMHQRCVSGEGPVSEIRTQSYSYGPSGTKMDDQGLFTIEEGIGNACVKTVCITHKYGNTERDGPLTVGHTVLPKGNNQTKLSRKCFTHWYKVVIEIGRSGGLRLQFDFSENPEPPTPINPPNLALNNNNINQNVRGLLNSGGITNGNANNCINLGPRFALTFRFSSSGVVWSIVKKLLM
ncbi:hypothetical protein O6P43_003646 [Quillaja saponaria]|uniref:Uncharacterized protein n=1 Tax=Quillaja saponaria TaxID=32244 RepID=A0AAD7VLN4_QUISA|nr:hypothetical protein O6P43_003646 [Quillaja saponaria]